MTSIHRNSGAISQPSLRIRMFQEPQNLSNQFWIACHFDMIRIARKTSMNKPVCHQPPAVLQSYKTLQKTKYHGALNGHIQRQAKPLTRYQRGWIKFLEK